MSKRSQEKRRARSKEKKQARRRIQAVSPMERLAGTAEENCECWVHYAPDDDRTRNVMAWRPVKGGGFAAAFFLVDMDCIGLKDAFWQGDAEPSALRENMREQSRTDGTTFVKVTLREARELVAGAMRWTKAHPFRLPAKTEQAIKLLGEPLDVDNAPVSDFGTEEGLFYLGYERDLEKALDGVTLDEFLAREDVECEFLDDEFEDFGDDAFAGEFDEDEEEFQELSDEHRRVAELADGMVELCVAAVVESCTKKGLVPSPELERAARIHVASIIGGVAAIGQGATEEKARETTIEMMVEMLEQQEDADPQELHAALAQITASGKSPDDLVNGSLARLKQNSLEVIDVPFPNALPMESPCSTPDTPSSPTC